MIQTFIQDRRRLIGFSTGLAVGLDYLNSATVNFAESALRSGIGASANSFLWILSAYAGAGMLGIALQERLNRQFRYRTLLLTCVALYTLGSTIATLSETLPVLIGARMIQGLGGGPLLTCGRVLLQMTIPPEKRGRQLQGFMLGLFILSAPGPWISALIMQSGDWHTLFTLHAITGLLLGLFVCWIVPLGMHIKRPTEHHNISTLVALCLGMFVWTHTLEALHFEPGSFNTYGYLLLACSLFAFIGWRIHTHPDPIFSPQILRNRRYLAGLTFYTLYYLISGALSLLLPMYLLAGESLDELTAGQLSSLGVLCTVVALPLYFRIAKHLPDRRYVMGFGFMLLACLSVWLSFSATGSTSVEQLLPILVLRGFFPLLVVIQVAGLTFREFVQQDFEHAYALKNVLRLLASTLGAGCADIYWQHANLESRNVLIARTNLSILDATPDPATLQQLSQTIDHQAALISASQGFLLIAGMSLFASVAVMIQKTLR